MNCNQYSFENFNRLDIWEEQPYLIQIAATLQSKITISNSIRLLSLPFHCYLYLDQGFFSLVHQNRTFEIKAPALLLIPKGYTCKIETINKDSSIHFLCLYGDVLELYINEIIRRSSLKEQMLPILELNTHSYTYKHTQAILQSDYALSVTKRLLIHRIFTNIFTDLITNLPSEKEEQTMPPKYLSNIKTLLQNNYKDNLSLDELENMFSKNKYRICREFTRYYKISPMKYLNQCRLEAARELLENTDLPIHEVAVRIGIENVNYFIKMYKDYFGNTPLCYRNLHRI